jgi:hypothetical protein
MREPYGESLASCTGPESCAANREVGREALTRAHAGGVFSREIFKSECRRRSRGRKAIPVGA